MRIAVVTETYPPEINGVAMTVECTVKALQARNHQIQLIRPKQNDSDKAASYPRFEEVLRTGLSIPSYSGLKMGLPAKAALTRLWMTKRPDIVHIATEGPLGWSALGAANKLKLPVTTDFHTNFHIYSQHYGLGLLQKPINLYLRKFHNKAECTLVPTESLRDELQAAGYHSLEVVGRGVDTTLFTPLRRNLELRDYWGAGEDDTVAIYVGRLAPEKNLDLAIEAYQWMHQANPATRLIMVGDGPERAALQALYPEVVFAGMRTGMDLAEHYASADIFLFPSISETFGNVILEAMASGLAIVAYGYAAAEEHIQHGSNGLLAEFDSSGDFLSLAVELTKNTNEAAQLGRSARFTAEKLGWDSIHDRFEEILFDIVDAHELTNTTSAHLALIGD